jgi:hypothetical protein
MEIPVLWPEDAVAVDVVPPIAILKTQASQLTQMTRGLLEGEVSTVGGDQGQVLHQLDVIAPALASYRHRLLTVSHPRDQVYPAAIQIEAGWSGGSSATQEEFLNDLRLALGSKHVRSLLQSLIARSNQEQNGDPLKGVAAGQN